MLRTKASPPIPSILEKEGDRTGFVREWHRGGDSDERRPGFDDWYSFFCQGQYENPPVNDNDAKKTGTGSITDILADRACQFIDRNAHRPFCLYLSHKGVHFHRRATRMSMRTNPSAVPPPLSTRRNSHRC